MKKILTIAIAIMMSMSLSGVCAQDTAVDTLWQRVYGAIKTIRANEKGELELVKAVNPEHEEDVLSMLIKLDTPSPLMLSDWMMEYAQERQQEEWNAQICQKRIGDQLQQMMNMSYSLAQQQYAYPPVDMEKFNALVNGKESFSMYVLMSAYQCGENTEAGMEIECVPFLFFASYDAESNVGTTFENAIYTYIRMVQVSGESEMMVSEYVVADQELVSDILSAMMQIEDVMEEDRAVIRLWMEVRNGNAQKE